MSGTEPGNPETDREMAALGRQTDRETDALERKIDLTMRRADNVSSGRAAARRRSPWLIAFTTFLGLAVVAAGALATYLWRTTDEWRAEAEERGAAAAQLEEQRDELAAELDQAQRDLTATEDQLGEVQDRLLSLANEQAQTDDQLAVTQIIAQDVADVAAQLHQCVQGQDTVIDALENIEQYDPDSVADTAAAVREDCDQARQASEDLERRLDGE